MHICFIFMNVIAHLVFKEMILNSAGTRCCKGTIIYKAGIHYCWYNCSNSFASALLSIYTTFPRYPCLVFPLLYFSSVISVSNRKSWYILEIENSWIIRHIIMCSSVIIIFICPYFIISCHIQHQNFPDQY